MPKPEIKALYKESKQKYEEHLASKFKNFSENKPFLFDMTIDYNKFDYDKLNKFLGVVKNIHEGKISTEDASKMVGQMQYDEYVKSKITDENDNEIKVNEQPKNDSNNEESMIEKPKKLDTDLKYV